MSTEQAAWEARARALAAEEASRLILVANATLAKALKPHLHELEARIAKLEGKAKP